MSNDKYPSVSSRQMEAIVFIILQISFEKRAVLKVGGISLGCSPVLARNIHLQDLYRPIMRERKYLMDNKGIYTLFKIRAGKNTAFITPEKCRSCTHIKKKTLNTVFDNY